MPKIEYGSDPNPKSGKKMPKSIRVAALIQKCVKICKKSATMSPWPQKLEMKPK
jgi:hypothetical protein